MNNSNSRCIALLPKIVIGLLLALLLFLWPRSNNESTGLPGCPRLGRRYGVMLDAGSTGSRVHVYELHYKANGKVELLDELFVETKPGLSSFADKPAEAAQSLVPMLEDAKKRVPQEYHHCTPIELKATAGLRLLGEQRSNAILREVDRLFRTYSFAVGPASAIVMDGKDEGPYAWMTVNFLLDTMRNGSPDRTAAVIDMGGASTQIVFLPDDGSHMKMVSKDQTYHVATEHFSADIYTHSHLGYGLKQAEYKLMRAHLASGGAHDAFPCFPRGYSHSLPAAEPNGREITVANDNSDQAYGACLALATEILNKKSACNVESCSFNGVAQPSLTKVFSGPLYVFSYYYDRMEPFLDASQESSIAGLETIAKGVCDGKVEPYAAHNKGTMCMDLTYLLALLRTGYSLPDTTPLHVKKKIKGVETAWALGAMMVAMK